MNLFGKKKAAATSSTASNGPRLDDAINALRSTQQMLDKRREHLDSEIEATKRQAKLKLQAKDKRGALSMLKRAKGMEVQRDQLYGKVENLDTQMLTLQSAISNHEVIGAMRQGHEALKLATKMTNADTVADMMEDISEGIADVEEMNNAMAQSLGPPLDEDELAQELDAMEQEMMEEQLLAAPDLAGSRNVSSKSTVTSAPVPAAVAAPSPAVVTPTAASQSQIDLIAQSLPTVPSSSNRVSAVTAPQPALSDRESQELRELEAAMQM